MQITRAQAAAILGTTEYRVRQLQQEGQLKSTTQPKGAARRCVAKFNDADVRALKRALSNLNTNGHALTLQSMDALPPPRPSPLASVLGFAQIDPDKRDVLLKLGQRYSAQDLAILLEL